MGVDIGPRSHPQGLEESLDELSKLTDTAGATVCERLTQHIDTPNKSYYIGKGKLEELEEMTASTQANVVIFDDELTVLQQRNLEDRLKVKIIDRVALILDIFSRHARTREGILQVELAQNEYLLPRLAGQWSHLERLGGGIGTRGPGETQIETDRRLVKQKISRLKRQIEQVRRHRNLYRSQRRQAGIPVIALVGYTNAGKSTLLNALTRAGTLVEDKLFATLDPITRRITLPDGRKALLSDTVGFIRKLPPSLVSAFRATLEELNDATLLAHVVDLSSPWAAEQYQTVEEILADLGVGDKPRITALNKADLLIGRETSPSPGDYLKLLPEQAGGHNSLMISAVTGMGLDRLVALMAEILREQNAGS